MLRSSSSVRLERYDSHCPSRVLNSCMGMAMSSILSFSERNVAENSPLLSSMVFSFPKTLPSVSNLTVSPLESTARCPICISRRFSCATSLSLSLAKDMPASGSVMWKGMRLCSRRVMPERLMLTTGMSLMMLSGITASLPAVTLASSPNAVKLSSPLRKRMTGESGSSALVFSACLLSAAIFSLMMRGWSCVLSRRSESDCSSEERMMLASSMLVRSPMLPVMWMFSAQLTSWRVLAAWSSRAKSSRSSLESVWALRT